MKARSKLNVAGLVVVYNSNARILDNICTYIDQIGKLFIVDNSEIPNDSLINSFYKFENAEYIQLKENVGIAKALNIGANAALNQGFRYLLTMDDDTSIPKNAIQDMLDFIDKNEDLNLGIVAGQSVPNLVSNSYRSVYVTITSGNLLDLQAYKVCGPFMNELFIDWVDHEYCIRLNKNKYSIVELNYIYIHHNLGAPKEISFINIRWKWVSHNPLRTYYKIRNTLYVMHKNALKIPFKYHAIFIYEFAKDLIKNMFFEDEKEKRAKYILKALRDYFRGNLGKYI